MKKFLFYLLLASNLLFITDATYAKSELTGVLVPRLIKYGLPKDLSQQDCYYHYIKSPQAMRSCRVKKKYCAVEIKNGSESCELVRMLLITGYGENYFLTDFIRKQDFTPSSIAGVLRSQVGTLTAMDFVTIQYETIQPVEHEYFAGISGASVTKMHDASPAINCVSQVDKDNRFFFGYNMGYDETRLQYDRKFDRLFRIDNCVAEGGTACSNFWGMINSTPHEGVIAGHKSSIDELSIRRDFFAKFGESNYDFLAQNSSVIQVEFDKSIHWSQLPFMAEISATEIRAYAKTVKTTNATLKWSNSRTGKSSQQELSGSTRLNCYRIHQR